MSEYLLEKLKEYSESDYYPLHMPGHKRRISHFGDPFAIDITEIEGFDNLHHAQGILLEAQKRAAGLYGAEETFYLVNGSTCGILAAVSACVPRGGRILMARNCHKAAYHAVFLNGLRVEYLYPEADLVRGINGSISPEAVQEALEQRQYEEELAGQEILGQQYAEMEMSGQERQDISAVLITSPTYDGVVSDIRRIAEAVHRAGAILIVDEAHGAHFAMHPYFPKSALECGADIVINSLHKTMPSLTQTALLHVRGLRVNRERLRKYLGIYQSSSPSYVLMAGMDACVELMQVQREILFDDFTKRLEHMRRKLRQMKALHLVDGQEEGLHAYDFDRSKILVSTENAGISGPELSGILRRKYHLEAEMEAERYVTAIMTVADTEEGFERLTRALLEIDDDLVRGLLQKTAQRRQEIDEAEGCLGQARDGMRGCSDYEKQSVSQPAAREALGSFEKNKEVIRNKEVMTIEEAENSAGEQVLLQDSAGRIAAEFVYLYPPGIPLLVPGEQISAGLLERLNYYQSIGLNLQGMSDYSGKTIYVVRTEKKDG
ncbi:MAG: PLP-dependent transferase [Lachnospiraceae bacterium]|nr:PLP-dependent transferase [Lachnospiraceae bacterium]